MTQISPDDFSAVLLDIEGTTTPIAFVHDVLFPFAAEHIDAFLERAWARDDVRADAAAIAETADDDDSLPEVRRQPQDAYRKSVLDVIRALMADDRKDTGLKSLQGKVWRAGYASGELQASLFPEVADTLRTWKRAGVPIYIYSSGSIAAQKLLFAHTTEGDLTPLLSGHFDTTTGSKKASRSYRSIAAEIGMPAEDVLFLTDVAAEAEAASTAGMQVAVMKRPGNHPQPDHDFPTLDSFRSLVRR